MDAPPHSADQFGEQRDFWWRRDFLDLMTARWRLQEAASLADIGCGLGHWSRLLYPYLREPARLTGVDREPRWIEEAQRRFHAAFPKVAADLFTFLASDASRIPLPDDSFEVVTCQTVLMHLEEPRAGLREMIRILRPGGLLVCVEPNNLFNIMGFTSQTPDEPVERIVRRFEFWLRYHRGKVASGQGNHCVGDLLPGYFAELGLADINVHQSDRAAPLFPPYDTAEQRALIKQELDWKSSATGPWDQDDLFEHVRAGGGSEAFCRQVYAELVEKWAGEIKDIEASRFHSGGGGITYLVSGRKLPGW